MSNAQALSKYSDLVKEGFTDHELNTLIKTCNGSLIEAMNVIESIRNEVC